MKWLQLYFCLSAVLVPILCKKITTEDDFTFINNTIVVMPKKGHPLRYMVTTSNLKASEINNSDSPLITVEGPISVLHKGSISDFPVLISITLDRNNLRDVEPGAFGDNLPKLEYIYINFQDSLTKLRGGIFDNLPKLMYIAMTGNKLKAIEAGAFNNPTIRRIDLLGNEITTIAPEAFVNMPTLLRLSLQENRLTEWKANWFRNTKINELIMAYNYIEELPDLAFKDIYTDEGNYRSFIDFQENKIKKIGPRAFNGVREINKINLRSNNIEGWDENLLNETLPLVLDISRNRIKCITGNPKTTLKAREIYIDYNPWECACLEKMKKQGQEWESLKMFSLNATQTCHL